MDDSRPPLPANFGEVFPAVVHQSVDQGAVRMSGGRMHYHAPGFVDHDNVPVLIHDIQRDILRRQGGFVGFPYDHIEELPGADLVVFPDRGAVSGDQAAVDQALGGRPGNPVHFARKESVDSLAALLCNDCNAINLHFEVYSARISSRENSVLGCAGLALGGSLDTAS